MQNIENCKTTIPQAQANNNNPEEMTNLICEPIRESAVAKDTDKGHEIENITISLTKNNDVLKETKVKTSENHGIKNKNELKVVNSKRELKYSEVLKIDNENKTNSEISAEKEVKTIICETINLDEKEITDIQKEEREIKDEPIPGEPIKLKESRCLAQPDDEAIQKVEGRISQMIKSHQTQLIISNDQPTADWIDIIFKEITIFNRRHIDIMNVDLEPFKYDFSEANDIKKDVKDMRNFLKWMIPIESITIKNRGSGVVFGKALRSKTLIKNSLGLSRNEKVTILKMSFYERSESDRC